MISLGVFALILVINYYLNELNNNISQIILEHNIHSPFKRH